jgi:hypothetical protein
MADIRVGVSGGRSSRLSPFLWEEDTGKFKGRMNDAAVVEVGRIIGQVTIGGSGVTVSKGQALGLNSTPAWVLATNVAAGNIPAMVYAAQNGVTGQTIAVTDEADIVTSAQTLGAMVWLGTAGNVTSTRPTAAGELRQPLGIALSATLFRLRRPVFSVRELKLELLETTSGEAAMGSRVALDSGNFEAPVQTNAQNEYALWGAHLPDNFVGLLRAEYWSAQDGAGAPTFSFTVGSVLAEVAHDAVTPDTSETSKAIGANDATDKVNVYEFSAALNAASIMQPGASLVTKVLQSDAGTVAVLHFGGRLIVTVAE